MSLEIILAPILTLIVVQVIKLATDGIKGNFNLKSLINTYGGMPSSHTAFVASLTAMVGIHDGVRTVAFAISVIFSLVIISDALVFRRHISRYGTALQQIIRGLPPDQQKSYPQVNARLGHTFPQVITGAIVGVAIAYLVHLIY